MGIMPIKPKRRILFHTKDLVAERDTLRTRVAELERRLDNADKVKETYRMTIVALGKDKEELEAMPNIFNDEGCQYGCLAVDKLEAELEQERIISGDVLGVLEKARGIQLVQNFIDEMKKYTEIILPAEIDDAQDFVKELREALAKLEPCTCKPDVAGVAGMCRPCLDKLIEQGGKEMEECIRLRDKPTCATCDDTGRKVTVYKNSGNPEMKKEGYMGKSTVSEPCPDCQPTCATCDDTGIDPVPLSVMGGVLTQSCPDCTPTCKTCMQDEPADLGVWIPCPDCKPCDKCGDTGQVESTHPDYPDKIKLVPCDCQPCPKCGGEGEYPKYANCTLCEETLASPRWGGRWWTYSCPKCENEWADDEKDPQVKCDCQGGE